jgi:hypothetical protein
LWEEGVGGSVSELARKAGVSFAAAHRELAAMRVEGLAKSERAGTALVHRANFAYREAGLVGRLFKDQGASSTPPPAAGGERVRGWLAAAGAPLVVSRPARGRTPPLEEVLANALGLSHQDAAVARVLPLVLWRHRERLDHGRLARAATRRNERQALGFFLELTGLLGGDPRLASLSAPLQDHRRTRPRPFFTRAQGRMARALAEKRTPALARRWGYLMNMDLDSFGSAFRKHVGAA